MEKGLAKTASSARARQERDRARQRAYTKRWRKKVEADQAEFIKAALNPDFEIHDGGTITAMMPDRSIVTVGFVTQSGHLEMETTRFPRSRVLQEVLSVLQKDLPRSQEARWDRFLARHGS